MNSPKRFTFRPEELLYRTRADSYGNFQYESPADDDLPKQAFFGVKACDVSGMGVLDRTFNSQFHDPTYDRRRRDTIVIGINCFEPGANCFCSTFDAGPDLKGGYDIGLSFLGDDLLIDIATDAGAGILAQTDMRAADRRLLNDARELAGKARRAMIKSFDLNKAVKLLRANYEHPYWKEPSARCLSCANCINVCPTCYCSRLTDLSSIDRQEFARVRMWDACQNLDFAATCAENFRHKRIDRLRQWVNHKLNWTIDQYGVAGCVGCGRCITWCPVGIDITEPVRRIGERGASLDG